MLEINLAKSPMEDEEFTITGEITDQVANSVVSQLLFLEADG
jgi:ATP-dependent protease ClpP protease subunit